MTLTPENKGVSLSQHLFYVCFDTFSELTFCHLLIVSEEPLSSICFDLRELLLILDLLPEDVVGSLCEVREWIALRMVQVNLVYCMCDAAGYSVSDEVVSESVSGRT